MKKQLHNNKGKIHPSPPLYSDHFSLLPAAIITLASTLSPQDKEVLAYLISCSTTPNSFSSHHNSTTKVSGSGGDHTTEFGCDCFRCYMSYWVRWDSSSNRELIHEIIEAYEDGVFNKKVAVAKSKKDRKKRIVDVPAMDGHGGSGQTESVINKLNDEVEKRINKDGELGCESGPPSTVRKLVSFVGERIWGVWGII